MHQPFKSRLLLSLALLFALQLVGHDFSSLSQSSLFASAQEDDETLEEEYEEEPEVIPTAGWDKMTDTCKERLWPVSSGGSRDEKVSCTFYDEVNQQIIVAGNSTSDDYAPAANEHGFVYALDFDANWKWGKFFYNVSFAVSTISGCHLDGNNNLVALAIGDSKPVIMEVNLVDGQVESFISLEKVTEDTTSMPLFYTYGAIYHDLEDEDDGLAYYYTSFIMDDYLQILKIDSSERTIKWNYQYYYTPIEADSSDVYKNWKVPGFLHQCSNDVSRMYLIGRFNHAASVIKFSKRNMKVDWKLEIGQHKLSGATVQASAMNEIYSYVQPESSQTIFACGYAWTDPNAREYRTASMFKVDEDGEVGFLYRWGDRTTTSEAQDVCRAINYDKVNNELFLLLEVTTSTLRPEYDTYSDYSAASTDILILTMKTNGQIVNAYNVNMRKAAISLHVGGNAAFAWDRYLVFGGYSWGYKTRMQNVTYTVTAPQYDSFVFKHDPEADQDCVYQDKASSSWVYDYLSTTSGHDSFTQNKYGSDDLEEYEMTDLTSDSSLFSSMANQFLAYSSRYSGAFDLQDTFKYPRMCATESVNLTTGVQYYRGQNENAYSVAEQSDAGNVLGRMPDATWLFQNGTEAEGDLGRFDAFDNGGTFYIQTDSEEAVKKQRTILRSCAGTDLYELYLYVDVLNNNYPDFETDPETKFSLNVGDVLEYRLPTLVDKEGNDEPEVYIAPTEDDDWPPFLFFDNMTNTLIFRPDSIWYQSYTYYFQIVVKEKNSDSVLYPYFCDVKVLGNEIDPDDYLNFTDIYFNMTSVDRNSRGTFSWTTPVNLTFVAENWDALFEVYVKNVTYKKHNQTTPLKNFEFTTLHDDNMTMDFQAEFFEPYMLGLLVKKPDKLYIRLKAEELLDVEGRFLPAVNETFVGDGTTGGMFLTDPQETRLVPAECNKDKEEETTDDEAATDDTTTDETDEETGEYVYRSKIYKSTRIELQFDFRNEQMQRFREWAEKTYWYLCFVVAGQFLMLFAARVGFLPLWTLIEYMQLCAFIPLYNFKLIPYLYDAFKPFLVSHLVLTNESHVLQEMEDDYFNINYDYYWLNIAKLGQALGLIVCLLGVIIVVNILVGLCYLVAPKKTKCGECLGYNLSQFKFNAYLRYYMLCYFDLTFFAVMKLVEGNTSTELRKMAEIASWVIFVLSVVIPLFIMFVVCRRFEVMKIKQAKAAFNTVVLKLDKQSRWRLVVPGYFFFRRLLTACLLSMPIDNTFIFLQYVFILMSSHAYVLFLVAIKPYQSPLLNNYMLANETFYSALIIAIFIFSDATPELNIKFGAGVVLIASIVLLIFANFLMVVVLMIKGRVKLKEEIKQAKLKRAEKELLEEEEEEDRRQRQKMEEEEFTRLPEDTTNMSQYDLSAATATNMTTGAEMLKGSKKRRDKKKNKGKNNNDDVQELSVGVTPTDYQSEIGNSTSAINDTTEPLRSKKEKKKKRKDKNKNRQDDVAEASMAPAQRGPAEEEYLDDVPPNNDSSDKQGKKTKGSSDEPSGSSSSDKKKKKKEGQKDKDDETPGDGQKDLL